MEFKSTNQFEQPKFSSPEEEIAYLRKQILEKEKNLDNFSNRERERVVSQTINEYNKSQPEEVLHKGALIPEKIRDEIVLKLNPEEHDVKMSQLVDLLQTKGILNTLSVVEKMENEHVQDDFHRFLVEYIKEGLPVKDFSEKSEIVKNLKRTLFEIILPDFRGDTEQTFKDLYHKMQQLYMGMLSMANDDEYMTFEIANSLASREFVFYISVSDYGVDLFEKQVLSIFPNARINLANNDFNVFSDGGVSVGCYVVQKEAPIKPIKTIEEMNTDPIRVLLNVFSKLHEHEEAAAVQIIFKPVKDFYTKFYLKGIQELEKGDKDSEKFYVRNTMGNKIFRGVSMAISAPFRMGSDNEKKDLGMNNFLLEQARKKIKTEIVSTNIRMVASAKTEVRANSILSDIKSSFNQFDNTSGNRFKYEDIKKSNKKDFFKKFSFRIFESDYDVPLNIEEVSSVAYLVSEQKDITPQLKTAGFKTAPSPVNVPNEGILLGQNIHRNLITDIYYTPKDRLRHFYVIGQTGTGKSTILDNMIIQDIKNGEGCCFIDPHGSDVQMILANIPKERYEDVIYFDPGGNLDRPMALNMLEYDKNNPQQKIFVVNELFGIFQKLYGESNPESMGPMFEQYFRNATMLVIEDPDTGCTLLDVARVLVDKSFREMKLSRCKNPIVINAWRENLEKAGGEAALANVVPYITSKFDVFLANDIMRPIIAQEHSSFDFRKVMDEKKILLVNLSKGRLGEINSNLIGLILVGKILMAALSRVDSFGKELPPFYLYIDEFQNITTPSISSILSEARKYGLSLNIAHQFIDQLTDGIRNSVFGNVGTICTYRVGSKDAEFLESQFSPAFEAKDIQNIDNFNAYIKMLSDGVPIKPFSLKALPPSKGNLEQVEPLKQLSYSKYGRDKEEIEEEISKRFRKEPIAQF
jgi:hypothetical protein